MTSLLLKLMDSTYDENFIYHYTNFTAAIRIINSRKLRLSNLINLNDPYEFSDFCRYTFDFISDSPNRFEELVLSSKLKRQTVRIFCSCEDIPSEKLIQKTTESFFSKGWARNRMWAQYADNHKGVCLVFNKNELKSCFEKLSSEKIKVLDNRVNYTNYHDDLCKTIIDNPNENYKNYFLQDKNLNKLFLKCQDFRDEYEYRFCLIDKELKSPEEEKFIDYGSSLKGIICGAKFNKNIDLQIIQKLISEKTELFEINWFTVYTPKLTRLQNFFPHI